MIEETRSAIAATVNVGLTRSTGGSAIGFNKAF
jgi:hypothetical protein